MVHIRERFNYQQFCTLLTFSKITCAHDTSTATLKLTPNLPTPHNKSHFNPWVPCVKTCALIFSEAAAADEFYPPSPGARLLHLSLFQSAVNKSTNAFCSPHFHTCCYFTFILYLPAKSHLVKNYFQLRAQRHVI